MIAESHDTEEVEPCIAAPRTAATAARGAHVHGAIKVPKQSRVHNIGFRVHKFRTVLSVKKHYDGPPACWGAAAFTLSLRWILCFTWNHNHRIAVLVNARSIIGTAATGLSCAPTWKRDMNPHGALTFMRSLKFKFFSCSILLPR